MASSLGCEYFEGNVVVVIGVVLIVVVCDGPAVVVVDCATDAEPGEDVSTVRATSRTTFGSVPMRTCREPEGAWRVAVLLKGPIEVKIGDARLVGSYGINLTFRPDGHRTGKA